MPRSALAFQQLGTGYVVNLESGVTCKNVKGEVNL